VALTVAWAANSHETLEAWRERDHDDLVLAVAIAVWLAECARDGPPPPRGGHDAAAARLGRLIGRHQKGVSAR
jgi:hypothetical protein